MTSVLSPRLAITGRSLSTAVLKTNFKRDIVYLYQFPRSPILPNLSPYCLKLETYLRIKNIKYEVIESYRHKSEKGLVPFIELNGRQIPDSGIIIRKLEKHFDCADRLTEEEKGIARALDRMLDCSTLHAIQLDRLVKNGHIFASRPVSGLPLPRFITDRIGDRMAGIMGKRMRGAFGKLSDEEIKDVLKMDLNAINSILGEKLFMFGEVPSAIDCSVFGHIASTYFLPYRQTLSDVLDDDLPSIKGLINRIRTHYYPEWKEPQ
ncbi:hypothetical protein PRIPAC_89845 [Pristionchus pacificus]|uniref:Uncharacterized protein n=1 Tax=Pristionchus pacificus TaxID=54126 RepID=A0A2A6B793_PRIPA|nr:hypothetical protein PRIPAC_89845 [Pristionchus pacificus]|eukprot:PDM61759.1 hypothetical protein PRIPAC_51201 [Pristionchus pacificus]